MAKEKASGLRAVGRSIQQKTARKNIAKANKPKKPPRFELDKVKAIAFFHPTQAEAAVSLGVARATFQKALKDDPRVREAWEEGMARGKITLRKRQFSLAMGNGKDAARMLIHLGKHLLEQTDEALKVELTGKDGGPLEVGGIASLVEAHRREQAKLIEGKGDKNR